MSSRDPRARGFPGETGQPGLFPLGSGEAFVGVDSRSSLSTLEAISFSQRKIHVRGHVKLGGLCWECPGCSAVGQSLPALFLGRG